MVYKCSRNIFIFLGAVSNTTNDINPKRFQRGLTTNKLKTAYGLFENDKIRFPDRTDWGYKFTESRPLFDGNFSEGGLSYQIIVEYNFTNLYNLNKMLFFYKCGKSENTVKCVNRLYPIALPENGFKGLEITDWYPLFTLPEKGRCTVEIWFD